MDFIEPCLGIGHNLSLICQMTFEDIKHQLIIIISQSLTEVSLTPHCIHYWGQRAIIGLKRVAVCRHCLRAQELCESRVGRPGLPVSNIVTSLMVSVAVKNHERRTMSQCDFVPHRNETLKWLSSQPLLMRDCHSGGDSVKSKNFNIHHRAIQLN